MKGAIYKITNIKNGMYYIGSTQNLHNRIRTHFKQLSCGNHHNAGMQCDYSAHGESAFTYEIIQQGDFDNILHLLRIETSIIRQGSKKEMYNIERNPLSRYKKESAKVRNKKTGKTPKVKKKKKPKKFYTVRGVRMRA